MRREEVPRQHSSHHASLITDHPSLAYVIGHPIGHSVSPAMHNAAFAACGLDARYEAVDVAPEDLASWASSARRADVLGFNVTVPHKEKITAHLDALEGDATLARAVNTVIVKRGPGVGGQGPGARGQGRGARGQAASPQSPIPNPESPIPRPRPPTPMLVGTNTDTIGFRRSLAEEAGATLRGGRVVLLGAGGAARAIAVVALQDGARELTVANRHVERAARLLHDLESIRHGTRVRALDLGDPATASALKRATVLINATSVGMRSAELPVDPAPIPTGGLVVDIVYNPPETELLRAARRHGARVLGGLAMLVHQAAAAFELWTGLAAPIGVMRTAAERAVMSDE